MAHTKGEITHDQCPIYIRKSKVALIDKDPISSPKGEMLRQKKLPSGFFLFVNFSAPDCIQMAMILLMRFGEDPSQFRVQLS